MTPREKIKLETSDLVVYDERLRNSESRWVVSNAHPNPQVAIPGAASGGVGVGMR